MKKMFYEVMLPVEIPLKLDLFKSTGYNSKNGVKVVVYVKRSSVGTKFSLLSLISIMLVTIVTVSISYFGNNLILTAILMKDSDVAVNAIMDRMDSMKTNSLNVATTVSADSDVMVAVKSGYRDAVIEAVTNAVRNIGSDVEFITITDDKGIAIARTHTPDKSGDSVLNQENVVNALNGISQTYIEEGTQVKLSIRSASPVKDRTGKIIGVISTGYRLDQDYFADSMKHLTGSEVTVFKGDTSISTSFFKDNQRQAEMKIDPKFSDIILKNKQRFEQKQIVYDKLHYSEYVPILNGKSDMVATIFIAKNIQDVMDEQRIITIVIVSLALIISILILVITNLTIKKLITKPLKDMSVQSGEIVAGNLEASIATNSRDELGEMSRNFAMVSDTFKSIVDEINITSAKINAGDIDARIDVKNYKGAYKDVIDGVNAMINGLISDTLDAVSAFRKLGDGEFNFKVAALPGKKIILTDTINSVVDSINELTSELKALVESSGEGKLDVRADASQSKGGWKDIVLGLNTLIDSVSSPINEAANVLQEVSKGNIKVKMQGDYKGDFALIKNSLNGTVDFLNSYIGEITVTLEKLANNDFNQQITREYVGEFVHIKNSINFIIEKLNEVLSDINSATNQVSVGAKQISESSSLLAEGAMEQTNSVQDLTKRIAVISQNTKTNAENAREANYLSDISRQSAASGNEEMKKMLASMNGIKESSNDISRIIKVIEDIAFQTNLLALNAAVEAARAGEHGKGFSVVAEEVRSLAARSQSAAKETTKLIEDSIEKVADGTNIANTTADALVKIVGNVEKVSTLIENITKSSEDQDKSIAQISLGLDKISNVTLNNSATSQESASSAEELSSQSEMLKNMVSSFKLKN